MEIGFIGLGDMGRRMAMHLLESHKLFVHNRTQSRAQEIVDAGAVWLDEPRDVADRTDLVFIMVSDDEACEDVMSGEYGLLSSTNHELSIINMSTITPDTSHKIATMVKEKSWNYLEAPVSGTLPHAENKQLIILTSGRQEIYDKYHPVLALMGRKIVYFGEIGNALRVKLVVNSILAAQTAILAEGLHMIQSKDLDENQFLDLINDSALGNVITKAKGNNMVTDSYTPLFKYKYIIKDLDYAQVAFGGTAKMPIVDAVTSIYKETLTQYADLDFSAIRKAYKT